MTKPSKSLTKPRHRGFDRVTVRSLALRAGYALESDDAQDASILRLRMPDGRVCVSISVSAAGPHIELFAESLSVHTAGDLALDCERLELRGRREVAIRAGDRLTQVSEGSIEVEAGGDLEMTADAQRLRARRGDIELSANDDVALDGERIRLNSPLVPNGRPTS